MQSTSLQVGVCLLFCLLGLGFLDTEAIANQNPFAEYSNCPVRQRVSYPNQLAVYRTL